MVNYICLQHQLFPLFYTSPNVRESKTLFDSGFHAVDSRFQILNYRFFASGSWISIITGIPDFLRSILDYKNLGFWIPKFQIPRQKLPGFWYSDSLMWGETLRTEVTLEIYPLYSCIYIFFIFIFQTRFYSLLNITQTFHLLTNKFTKLLYKVWVC